MANENNMTERGVNEQSGHSIKISAMYMQVPDDKTYSNAISTKIVEQAHT